MKVNAVIRKPTFISDNTQKSAVISGAVIASGFVIGVILYLFCKDKLSGDLLEYFINFTTYFSNKNKPEIFSGLILQNIFYYVLMLIFGTSVLGTPMIFIISFIKSAGLGVLVTYIYEAFSLKGIEYCLLVFFPGKFILILSMVLLTQNCYYMSVSILNNIRNADSRGVDFKKFSIRSLVIFMFVLLASTIDFAAIVSFSSLFDFR